MIELVLVVFKHSAMHCDNIMLIHNCKPGWLSGYVHYVIRLMNQTRGKVYISPKTSLVKAYNESVYKLTGQEWRDIMRFEGTDIFNFRQCMKVK